ncbi:hypothetical protein, partial [Mycobacterium marinum]|uniref:hypothetical protein n=1 Tax=Mycobacterium marinum TaxID=1781 RepID=UPI003BAEE941
VATGSTGTLDAAAAEQTTRAARAPGPTNTTCAAVTAISAGLAGRTQSGAPKTGHPRAAVATVSAGT